MHAKTHSEVTSNATSSPTRSPRRPAYYVQSPSRDSHDGDKTATSFHSTPVLTSPMDSPPHSRSSLGRHSRESSSTRFSGSLKPGSRKISPNDVSRAPHRKGQKPWNDCDAIQEEGLLEDEDKGKSLPRRCYLLAFILGFLLLFSFFALVLWGASRPMKPKITMKSITFEQFRIQAGSDFTGVATDMASVNSSVKLIFRNTGSFFGVHVSSTPVDLTYSEISVASGTVKKFYQSRKSQRSLTIHVIGTRVPLYGSGASLSSSTGTTATPVPLKLSFVIRSRAYVLGQLVKPKFYRHIDCPIIFDPKKLNVPMSLKNCTFLRVSRSSGLQQLERGKRDGNGASADCPIARVVQH
ncbi:hypothetical protein SDJN02_07671, partial [Cucurbita argyrosperma subsp. argyrosperma]